MTYCKFPWKRLTIGQRNVFRPCCRYYFEEGELPQIDPQSSLLDQLNHQTLVAIREKLLKGEPATGCFKCVQDEEVGIRSLRQASFDVFEDDTVEKTEVTSEDIVSIELFVGRECNLKCRMCGPTLSSSWVSDYEKLTGEHIKKTDIMDQVIPLLPDVLSRVRQVKMLGGEPMISPVHRQVLKALCGTGRSKEITLEYNTNCTVSPSTEIVEMWKEFEFVNLFLSIDGFETVHEYIRNPCRWKQVVETAQQFLKMADEHGRMRVSISPVVSVYNIPVLNDLYSWWRDLFGDRKQFGRLALFDTVIEPNYLNPQILPMDWKKKVEDHLSKNPQFDVSPIIDFMNKEDGSHLMGEFEVYTRKLDMIRQECFEESNPFYRGLLSVP